eukprot:s408_g27.t1
MAKTLWCPNNEQQHVATWGCRFFGVFESSNHCSSFTGSPICGVVRWEPGLLNAPRRLQPATYHRQLTREILRSLRLCFPASHPSSGPPKKRMTLDQHRFMDGSCSRKLRLLNLKCWWGINETCRRARDLLRLNWSSPISPRCHGQVIAACSPGLHSRFNLSQVQRGACSQLLRGVGYAGSIF